MWIALVFLAWTPFLAAIGAAYALWFDPKSTLPKGSLRRLL